MSSEWSFPNEATPAGSGPYYLARFAPRARRDAIAAWLAWFSLFERAAQHVGDPTATRLKLDWWREEIERIGRGTAQHPLGRVLVPLVRERWQIEQMQRLVNATEERLLGISPMDFATLEVQCRDEQAPRLHLLADSQSDKIEAVACHVGVIARLQRLPIDLQRHHLSLPFGRSVEMENLLEAGTLGELGDRLLEAAEACLPTDPSDLGYEPHAILAQQRRAARLLRAHRYPTRRLVSPTPIGLLWSTWRARRTTDRS